MNNTERAQSVPAQNLARTPQTTDIAQTDRSKRSAWRVLKETVTEWIADKASQLAAALAYYTAVSLAPMLVLVVVIAGLILGRQQAESQLLTQLNSVAGPQQTQFIRTILDNAKQPTLASLAGILSFITLLWGSTNLFAQLQGSLNTIWEVKPKPGRSILGVIRDRGITFLMVLGVAFLLLASMVISAVLSALLQWGHGILPGASWIWQGVNYLVSFLVITFAFAAIYRILPDADITWRDVWLGAGVTAVLFLIGNAILSWYLANAGNAYGAASSVVVFLLWVYYTAQVLFLGAEFTQVYARYYGSGIRPSAGAIRVEKTAPA